MKLHNENEMCVQKTHLFGCFLSQTHIYYLIHFLLSAIIKQHHLQVQPDPEIHFMTYEVYFF